MVKTATKVAALSAGPGPSATQRAWVRELSAFSGRLASEAAAGPGAAADQRDVSTAAEKSELVGLGLPDIPFKIACNCRIANITDRTLKLDSASIRISSGKLDTNPPDEIFPNETDVEFRAVNKFPFLAGAEGQFEYIIDEQNTRWLIGWDNARLDPLGNNEAPSRVEGPNKGRYTVKSTAGSGEQANFSYTLKIKGAPGPQPGPQPGPTPPAKDIRSNCVITVNNKTGVELTLIEQGHDRGDFMSFPPTSVPAGGTVSFISVETPDAKEQGCKGFVVWDIGSPPVASWRIEWDNPEAEKNTAKSGVQPASAGFRSLHQIGQDDQNVPAVFTLSGGGQGPGPTPVPPKPVPVPPNPGPVPPVPPEPKDEPEFKPPPGSRQPTLRLNDKSPDGWVEYLQQLLNFHLNIKLDLDGKFGPATQKAVIAFQKQKNLEKVDGVVGNETWSALRESAREKPGTDGRQPHTFEEKGAQARWQREDETCVFHTNLNEAWLLVNSVGEKPIDDFKATVRVTRPNAKPKVLEVKIGPPNQKMASGAGDVHIVKLVKFRETFMAGDSDDKVSSYVVEAFFPAEIGGDLYKGKIFVN